VHGREGDVKSGEFQERVFTQSREGHIAGLVDGAIVHESVL